MATATPHAVALRMQASLEAIQTATAEGETTSALSRLGELEALGRELRLSIIHEVQTGNYKADCPVCLTVRQFSHGKCEHCAYDANYRTVARG